MNKLLHLSVPDMCCVFCRCLSLVSVLLPSLDRYFRAEARARARGKFILARGMQCCGRPPRRPREMRPHGLLAGHVRLTITHCAGYVWLKITDCVPRRIQPARALGMRAATTTIIKAICAVGSHRIRGRGERLAVGRDRGGAPRRALNCAAA